MSNMQEHLIAISIGPVQDFIAAARRTGDLTAGSQLLSDIARATAQSLEGNGAKLIFPASVKDDGPNKILVSLPAGKDPCLIVVEAKLAAKGELKRQWDIEKHQIPNLNVSLADAQVEAFLEFYAAWMPIGADGYSAARSAVDAKLAARKNLRDFALLEQVGVSGEKGVRGKDPLDPSWDCVFTRLVGEDDIPDKDKDTDKAPLWLKKTETLGAISSLKRLLGDRREGSDVPSTRDVASWRETDGGKKTLVKRRGKDADDDYTGYPYFAILAADGDNMGTLLDSQDSEDKHRELSTQLVAFCKVAEGIVAQHDGHLVYAGGDDVLAFLPVDKAVECATKIREAFSSIGTTLSAGVAVVHYKEPLAYSLAHARDAERLAKDGGRDSLCLAIHTRGGVPLCVTQKWADWENFDTWIEGFEHDQLTRGVAYELKNLVKECSGTDLSEELIRGEAKRIWDRKQPEGKTKLPFPELQDTYTKKLATFADVLIAARFLTGETK